MSTESRYVRDPSLPFQEIEGQAVVVFPARREFHQMDEVATFLWNRLDRPRSAAEMARALCAEFEVDPDRAMKDILSFLDDLEQKGLATRV